MIDKQNNFSFIHWLALVLVILGHQYVLMNQTAPLFLDTECSNLGVRILFIVSGYLTMQSCLNNSKTYLAKRVKRIFPSLIVCVLGMAFIIGPLFTKLDIATYFKYC